MAAKAKAENNSVGTNRVASVLDAPATMRPEIVVFKIVGISPLLQNNPAEFIGKSDSGDALATKKVYKDDEEAALRVYKDPDGNFVHPAEAFLKSMLEASKGRKFGKVFANKLIRGSVFIAEPYCIIENENGEPATAYTIDRRSVVINKKARVLRCRPCWNLWRLKLALELDLSLVRPEQIWETLSLAGRIIGVGDNRVEKGGGFGRYRLEQL